jgi:hypothetical protein
LVIHDVERPGSIWIRPIKDRESRTTNGREFRGGRWERIEISIIPIVVRRPVSSSDDVGRRRENWQWVSGEVIERERHMTDTITTTSRIGHDSGRLPTRPNQQHVYVGWAAMGDIIKLDRHFCD